MKETQVHEWHKCFHEGHVSGDDDVCSKCTSTITNEKIVKHVQGIIPGDRRKSVEK